MSLLSIKNLHATVGGNEIVKGINLEIGPGEIHAVMGPNGSGKSTLSYVLAGREGYQVTRGTIAFKGKDLIDLAADERANEGVFLAFQYPVEVPGVVGMTFLREAYNATRVPMADFSLSFRSLSSARCPDSSPGRRGSGSWPCPAVWRFLICCGSPLSRPARSG